MEPVTLSFGALIIIAICLLIIIACLIYIGIKLASTGNPDWADSLIKLGKKFKEIQQNESLSAQDCTQLRQHLKAAIAAGLPTKVGSKLSELLNELCN